MLPVEARQNELDYHAFEKGGGRMCMLILERLQRKLDISLSKAQEYFHRYRRQTV